MKAINRSAILPSFQQESNSAARVLVLPKSARSIYHIL
jgi:hypothetical protein